MLFWTNAHRLTPVADKLHRVYMPRSGSTEYVETEVYRAILRLHHDYFNNGFGNNMSQAVEYIDRHYVSIASNDFIKAYLPVKEEALQPTGQVDLNTNMDTLVAEIVVYLDQKVDASNLTILVDAIEDMPIIPLEDNYEEDEEDEEA